MITVTKTYQFDPQTDLIGKGGFGRVYRATDTNLNMQVAIKKYSGNLPTKYSLFEEIKRVIHLSHPNLVRYFDAFELHESSSFGDKIQVGVLEFVNGGDLSGLLRTATKNDTELLKEIIIGVMSGLQYLHSQGIIHRDMKPENILLQKNGNQITPKIADFGISKVISDSSSGNSSLVIGSIEYMAPEQFNLSKYGKNGKLQTNLDLWSLGVIIYEAFCGKAPFGKTQEGISRDEIMRNILEKDLSEIATIPAPFNKIAKMCLVRSAEQRAQSIDQLFEVLYRPLATNLSPRLATAVIHRSHLITEQIVATDSSALSAPISTNQYQFSVTYLLPFLTFVLGSLFFANSASFFDVTKLHHLLYPSVISGVLLLVNIIGLFAFKAKRHEFFGYFLSFTALLFYGIMGFLLLTYAQQKAQFAAANLKMGTDLNTPIFQSYYPLMALALLGLLLAVRYKQLIWVEMISVALCGLFWTYQIAGTSLSSSMAWVLAVAILVLCGGLGAMLKQRDSVGG